MQLKELSQERDQLRGKVQEQNNKLDQLSQAIQECKTTERLLEQRAKQLEVGKHGHTSNISNLLYFVSRCFYQHLSFSAIFYVYPFFSLVPQREKQQVEEVLNDVRRNEEEMCQSNQSLLTRLEDVQVKRGYS